ncbi:hypothetical protein M8C21_023835 [Ambrosia artemisiifolia]|uniref:Uncharacterized protein n=1 Tax=Ambrosia artemisiifolia TaxID=4212 RepID=A0AAD5CH87_AMBAR|nr:hypothetical protein M8C21_023835 [Ambrosia artemisiifolia]
MQRRTHPRPPAPMTTVLDGDGVASVNWNINRGPIRIHPLKGVRVEKIIKATLFVLSQYHSLL